MRHIIEQNPTARVAYTGAPLIGCRADIVIVDDGVSEDKVATPELADKNNTHINELVPILDINPTYDMMFVIGTPKSYNDYYAIGSGKAASNDTDNPTPVFECIRRSSLEKDGEPDINGEPILPTVFTRDKLMQIMAQCSANPAQGEGFFYREYQTMVQAPQDQKFLPEWLDTWVDPQQVPPNTIFTGIAVDSALKDEQVLFKGDNMVILIGHVDTYSNLYLTDGARSKAWRMDDFRKVLLSMVQNPKNRNPQNFIKEKVGEGVLFPEVRRWFTEVQKPVVIHPVKVIGQGKKYLRITEALQGPLMARKILFVRGQFPVDLHKVLVDELIHLGQWGHDDAVDCLALFFHPDVRPPTIRHDWKETAPVRMVRPMQLSTMRSVPAMAGWQAKQAALRPILDASGALIDGTLPIHEQVLQRVAQRQQHLLDHDGRVTHIDPGTGKVLK
jgi:hypothetical protein